MATQASIDKATQLYANLGRAPDQEGLDFWAGQYDSGADNIEDSFKASARTVANQYLTGDYQGDVPELSQITQEGVTPGSLSGQYETMAAKNGLDTQARSYLYPQLYVAPPKPPGIVAGGGGGGIDFSAYQPEKLSDPTAWNVTPDQTVESRINSIINPNSPLMQKASAQALDAASGRGLSNSSMAVTAGQSAMLDAALPIASQDAQTFAKAAGYNADIKNQFAVRNQDAVNQFNLSKMQFGTQWATAKLSADTQVNIAQMNNANQRDIATLNSETQRLVAGWDNETRMAVTQIQTENSTLLQTNSQAAQAFNTAMSAIDHIQNNPQMDAATKTQAIAQIWNDTRSQLAVLSAVSGLNLISALNFANMPGFDANGQWIGFPESGADTETAQPGDAGSGSGNTNNSSNGGMLPPAP